MTALAPSGDLASDVASLGKPAPLGTPAMAADPSQVAPNHLLNAICVLVFILNLVLVGGVNILFTFVSINGTSQQVILMQVALMPDASGIGAVWICLEQRSYPVVVD